MSNSPAIPLPTAFYSAAGRLGQIVSKFLIGNMFSMSRGPLWALKSVPSLPAAECRRVSRSPDPAAMLVEFNWGFVVIIYPCHRATQTYF